MRSNSVLYLFISLMSVKGSGRWACRGPRYLSLACFLRCSASCLLKSLRTNNTTVCVAAPRPHTHTRWSKVEEKAKSDEERRERERRGTDESRVDEGSVLSSLLSSQLALLGGDDLVLLPPLLLALRQTRQHARDRTPTRRASPQLRRISPPSVCQHRTHRTHRTTRHDTHDTHAMEQ
jgi:hypothetical protein